MDDLAQIIRKLGRPIAEAPRDGSLIILMDEDVGTFPMRWGHIQQNGLFPGRTGMWVMSDGSMTWQDGEDEGPSYWCTLEEWNAQSPSPGGYNDKGVYPLRTCRAVLGRWSGDGPAMVRRCSGGGLDDRRGLVSSCSDYPPQCETVEPWPIPNSKKDLAMFLRPVPLR